MNHLDIQPVGGAAAVCVITVVLLGLLALIRPTNTETSRFQSLSLTALRCAVILLLLFALLRPTLVFMQTKPILGSLLLLIDDSRSMQIKDSLGNESRWAAIQATLKESENDLARLNEVWDIQAYRFNKELTPIPQTGGVLQLPNDPQGQETSLGAAIKEALDRTLTSRVLAMALLSDGAQRASTPRNIPPQIAVQQLADAKIPLYTLTFGSSESSSRSDVRLDDFSTNEIVLAQNPTEVYARIQAVGYANQPATVKLTWEHDQGKMPVVDTRKITLPESGQSLPIKLQHTPTTPGDYKVTLQILPLEGELVTENNSSSTFVSVREGGLKILYLVGSQRQAGGPGREQRFVRSSLAASPDVLLTRKVFDYRTPNLDLSREFKKGKYDVILLDNVDRLAMNQTSWEALVKMVQQGAGLMVTGGYHSFGAGGHRDSALRFLLPFEMGRSERQDFNQPIRKNLHLLGKIKIKPTVDQGKTHPVLQLAKTPAASLLLWQKIPPLLGANRIERHRLKPNAMVLAVAENQTASPLLIASQPGAGRVLTFAGDSTWRWVMQGEGEAHRRFWRQAMLWLMQQEEKTGKEVWVRLPQRRVTSGSRLDFTVGLDSVSKDNTLAPKFLITITSPDGTKHQVKPLHPTTPAAQARARFTKTQTSGDYQIEVSATDSAGKLLGLTKTRFYVPLHDLELDQPGADPNLMAQIARMTAQYGGKNLAPSELSELLQLLAKQKPEVQEEVLARFSFWDSWQFFLLFVLLLTVEWYLRKKWGLV